MTNENQPKDKLDRLMREGAEKAQRIIRWAASAHEWAQQVVDLSNAGREVMKYPTPTEINWGTVVVSWQQANNQADMVLRQMSSPPTPALYTSGSGLNFTMSQFVTSPDLYSSLPPHQQAQAISAQADLSNIIDQSFKKENVIALMRQFDLEPEFRTLKTG